MVRNARLWLGAVALALAALAPARAAESQTKYLPDDTEFIVQVNFRQILQSPLVKKEDMEKIKAGLQKDEVKQVLGALGFDPLKDLNSVTLAGPVGAEPTKTAEKALIILTGKFSLENFRKQAEAQAKEHADVLKITKQGKHVVWEVTLQNPPPNFPEKAYVCLVDDATLLAAGDTGPLKAALAKADGTKKTELKKKDVAKWLAGHQGKQSFTAMIEANALGDALENANVPNAEQAKQGLAQLKTVSLGVTLTNEVKIEVGIGTKDDKTARQMSQKANQGLMAAPALIQFASQNNPQIAPYTGLINDVLKTIKIKPEGATVKIRSVLTKEMLAKMQEAAKKAQKGEGE